ncbi:Protein T07G12.3 [Aphelenchoides avenae]|nr:Protein T07G12.3 [Aphelenchus avenae]
MDPWDPEIGHFIDPDYNPVKNCTPRFSQYTRLLNGTVVVDAEKLPEGANCQYRCLYPKDDYSIRYGPWIEPHKVDPDCDVIEVHCWLPGEVEPFHKDIHLQIKAAR